MKTTATRAAMVFAATLFTGIAVAQMLTGDALVAELRRGGHVIVMRHASSPRELPTPQTANPDNLTGERQLDEKGRTTATAMGQALRRLKIPIGDVLTSPTYRARETARLAQLPNPKSTIEIGDGGQSMQVPAANQAAWLKGKVTEQPRGSNTILITHMPNIAAAFPEYASVEDGEALVFGAAGKVIGRIKIDEWPLLK